MNMPGAAHHQEPERRKEKDDKEEDGVTDIESVTVLSKKKIKKSQLGLNKRQARRKKRKTYWDKPGPPAHSNVLPLPHEHNHACCF